MAILVTNDDGILSEGLWALVKELKSVAPVVVVAPDREQSAVGTAVTLRQPLRVHKVNPPVPDVEAYSVEGTPSDSVILALSELVRDRADMTISGINHGANLGDDVLISGTVGAALQGFLRGLPALAISAEAVDSRFLDTAAKFAALLVRKMDSTTRSGNIFLNINLPDLPLAEIKGLRITQLGSGTHINTAEEGSDGRRSYYWLVRQKADNDTHYNTDIAAIEQGNISITPLHSNLHDNTSTIIPDEIFSDLLQELRDL